MPLAANALRFSDAEGVAPRPLGRWMVLAVLAALMVGVFATIYVQYNSGGTSYGWLSMPARMPFDDLSAQLWRFSADRAGWRGFDIGQWAPNPRFLYSAAAGLGLVLLCGALRLRFQWWPIHPVLFMLWGTHGARVLAAGFLVGWFIKMAITRLGGHRTYQRAKPLFVGLMAGEFVAGIFWMVVGLTYYVRTGAAGPIYRVHN